MKETSYLLQAALISAWWVCLSWNQDFFNAFQFDEIPPTAFWSFFVPDIVLIASLVQDPRVPFGGSLSSLKKWCPILLAQNLLNFRN